MVLSRPTSLKVPDVQLYGVEFGTLPSSLHLVDRGKSGTTRATGTTQNNF